MRRTIRPIVLGLTISASLAGSGVLAGERASVAGASEAAAPAAKTCLEAEVNPVTGAPVEAPPAASELPCESHPHVDRRLDLRA
ncbi:MAG: hypothetical protein WA441_11820 [Methyloceanibacter sp.]